MPRTHADDERQALDRPSARRRFLLKTLGLGAAGLAAGGAAAWTKGQLDEAAISGASLADLKLQLDQITVAKDNLQLSYTTLQARTAELETQLAAASGQSAQLATALTTSQQEASDLRTQLAAVQGALDAANTRLARTQELVGLFDQLEGTGLDGVVEAGLGTVTGALAAIAGPAGLLRSGLEAGRGLLGSFEQQLPDLQSAMTWLGDRVVRLKVGLWSVESSAKETAAATAAGIAAVFGGFVGFVLDNLPFDIGKRVRATLTAVEGVLTGLLDLTDNAPEQVMLKVSQKVDDNPKGWKHTLVKPLRDNTFAPADEVLSALSSADASYAASLRDPAAGVLATRRSLREQIAAFRATHGV